MSTPTRRAGLADGLDRCASVIAAQREKSQDTNHQQLVARKLQLLRQLNGDLPRPVYARKTIRFATDPNQHYKLRRLILHEGRWPSSRTLGWDAVDAAASGAQCAGRAGLKTCEPQAARRRTMLNPPSREASADGYQARRKLWRRWPRTAKPCGPGTRCWCQVGGGIASPTGPSQNRQFADDGDKTNSSPGRARHKPLKPLRAGMPGVPVDLWRLPCAFYLCTRAAGATGTRHSPRPLSRVAHALTCAEHSHPPGRIAPREAKPCLRQAWPARG
jgi:hypothetical protein